MKIQNNIFDGLTRNEDTLTELLRNICVHPELYDLGISPIFDLAKINGVDFTEYEVTTQFSTNDAGNSFRPDILIKAPNCIALVENKVLRDTTLTANQPGAYLEFLRNNFKNVRAKYLIFLIPRDYKAIDKLNDRYVAAASTIPMRIIFWEDYLTALVSLRTSSKLARFLLSEFVEACKRVIEVNLTKIEFTSQELQMLKNANSAAVYGKIHHDLWNIKSIIAANRADFSLRSETSSELFVYNMQTKKGQWLISFGLIFDQWAKTGRPISIFVYNNHYYEKVIAKIAKSPKWQLTEDELYYVYQYPVSLYKRVNHDQMLADIILEESRRLA